jgi:hypothetical protein
MEIKIYDVRVLKDLGFLPYHDDGASKNTDISAPPTCRHGNENALHLGRAAGVYSKYKDVLPAQFHVNHFSDHEFDAILHLLYDNGTKRMVLYKA